MWGRNNSNNNKKPAIANSDEGGFDDLIINQTNIRIQEELSNLSADELKASIIVGVIPTIFGLLAVFRFETYSHIFSIMSFNSIILLVPLGILVTSFFFGLRVLLPRGRFDLWIPRDSNNEYSKLTISQTKKKLKEERIEDFEDIEKSRKTDAVFLVVGYLLLFVGSVGIFIAFTVLTNIGVN